MYLAREAVEKYDKKGEVAAREGIRNLGAFRGREIKRWHEAEGVPINVESLVRFWDTGGRYSIPENETRYSPYDVQFSSCYCPLYEAWKEEGLESFGYWFCDEMHQEMVKAYNENAIVEIHENLNKNDGFCGFRFMMVPAGDVDKSSTLALIKRMQDQAEDYEFRRLKQSIRCVGATYVYMAQSFTKHFGEENGANLLAGANRKLGEIRGKRLKRKIALSSQPMTVARIFANFDLPYERVWKMKETTSEGPFSANVDYCPFAEVWKDLQLSHLGVSYCQSAYKSLFQYLNKEADIRVPECLAANDRRCRFRFNF